MLAAQVENPGMGPEATPELLVGLRSTAEEALFLGHDARWPAGGLLPDRDTEPSGLRLLSTGEVTDFTVEAGACRTTRYRPGDGQLGGHRVAAGDRVRGRFAVLGQGSALGETCPGEGRYRVEATYPYTTERAVREVGFGAAEKQRFRWGFTLVVRERG